jgi:hypothetical protein
VTDSRQSRKRQTAKRLAVQHVTFNRSSWKTLLFVAALVSAVLASVFTASPAFASGYHTVTFVENDNDADMVYTTQTEDVPTSLTVFSNLSPAFLNSGYTFADWNTSDDGSGTSYADGATYSFGAALVLYAIWEKSFHTVTFVENDNVSDSVDATQTENSSSSLTAFASMNPAFSNAGFTFGGWNTAPNGSGVTYVDGATYDFNSALVLYAIWVPVPIATAVFDDSGGTGTIAPIDVPVGTSITLPGASTISFAGHAFAGWNTGASGNGVQETPGSTYVINSNVTFYAQWVPYQYLVTYFPDGGTLASTSATYTYGGIAVTLPAPTLTGSIFNGWYSAPSGGAFVGVAGAQLEPSSALNLYAQWTPIPTINVNFSPNGGVGSIGQLSGLQGSSVLVPAPTGISNSNSFFLSWNTAANGSGISYQPGSSLTLATSLTLFAQWQAVPTIQVNFVSNGAVGSVSPLSGNVGATVVAPSGSGLSDPNYSFGGWNTAANGSGTWYQPGSNIILTSSLTLYAQWVAVPQLVVTLVSNGGAGSLPTLSGSAGSTVVLPVATSLVRSGYRLTSWTTVANGSGTSYAPGATVTLATSLTLYAQWKGSPSPVLYGAVGDFAGMSSKLTSKMKTEIHRLGADVKAKKYTKVTLYGYSAETGLQSLDLSLSSARAKSVATYLRNQLSALKARGVAITTAGEGAVTGETSAVYSRVEVFLD